MPTTFSNATAAHLGGTKLVVTFNLATAATVDESTRTLTVLMQDLSSSAPAQVHRFDRGHIFDGLNDVEGAKMTKNSDGSKLTISLDPTFGSKLSTKVVLRVIENNLAANGSATEASLANLTVILRAVPSAPVLTLAKPFAFTVNGAGNGVLVGDGVARVAIALKEGTTRVKVFAKGTLANGDNFAQELSSSPITVAADAKYVDVHLNVMPPLAHEKPVHIFAMSENDEGDSDPSTQLTALPSLRLAAPKLHSVKSLEDGQITVQGALPSLPQGNASRHVSILAKLKSQHDEENPLDNWHSTNVINVQFTSSSPSASFKKDVKQIRNAAALANLENGKAYLLAAIHHTATITASDNHPLDPESLTAVPAFTQSYPSNILSGACITYPADTVDLNADSQTSSSPTDPVQHVTFSPSIENVGTMTGLPLTTKWSFVSGGVAKTQYTDTGDFGVPTGIFFKVTNPVKGAKYVVGLELQQPLTDEAAACITGEAALKIVKRDNIPYAIVKTFEKTVEQTPSSDDVPAFLNFEADCHNIAGRRVLHTVHNLPAASAYADKGLALVGFEIQAMGGVAGSADDASYVNKHKLTAGGAITLFVAAVAPINAAGSTYGDLPELNAVRLFNNAGAVVDPAPGYHSIRIRPKVKVTKSNAEFYGLWQSETVEVQGLKLNTPAEATLTQALDLTSDPNYSRLKVTHVSVTAADVSGLPTGWAGAKVFGYEAKLVDSDGYDVEGASASKPFTDVESADAVAGAVTSSQIFSLRTSEGKIYSARVRHQYQRVSASGELMADKSYGGWRESQTYIIKGKLSISSVLVKTSPISSNPSGRDQNGMESLSVEVGLNIGQMNPSNANITLFAKGLTAAGIAQSVWQMSGAQYNAIKKTYSITFAADPTADYNHSMFIHAAHSDFSNGDARAF